MALFIAPFSPVLEEPHHETTAKEIPAHCILAHLGLEGRVAVRDVIPVGRLVDDRTPARRARAVPSR